MARQHIHIILTGGTIDSEWNPSKDTATTAKESKIPAYFEKLKPDFDLTFETVVMKDSRELTGDDIKAICEAVNNAPAERVLITHGTYTMPDTARYIEQNMNSEKAVILTGSIIPLQGYDMSDAPFNLGFAMAQLLNMQSGVKIVLQGHVFAPQDVGKNLAEGRFFSLEDLSKS